MNELNEKQKEAVNHKDGPCLVIASPGSGKTFCITERTIKLIEDGVNSKSLLCLTFTNKAAEEMKKRIEARLNRRVDFYVGTFHAFCSKLLRVYSDRVGYSKTFSILDDDEQLGMMEKVARQLGYSIKDDKIPSKMLVNRINGARDSGRDASTLLDVFDNDRDKKIVQEYLDQTKASNMIDFAGLLFETRELINNFPEVLEKLQDVFRYLQIDEMQDTNLLQFQIIQKLGAKYKNLFLVGDIDQSLYSFRHARYQNILDFLNLYPECKKITLGVNYRSTPQIVKNSEILICKNSSHIADKYSTVNPSGEEISCYTFENAYREATFVARRIKDLVQNDGYKFSDFAVLYRINRLSIDLQSTFLTEGVPCVLIGGFSIFDRKEIKDVLAMARFAVNPNDVLAFHRVSKILPGIGETTIGSLENEAKKNKMDLLTFCQQIEKFGDLKKNIHTLGNKISSIYSNLVYDNPAQAIKKLIDSFDYINILTKTAKDADDGKEREKNVLQFLSNSIDFSKKNKNLYDYLERIALASSADKENDGNSVSLMTGHAAKGLEFPVVFLVGAEHEIIPSSMAISEAATDAAKLKEVIEEERRIFYVCMTRAQKKLFVTTCESRLIRAKDGKMYYKKSYPSQYIEEACLNPMIGDATERQVGYNSY
jgi:DNA helicase-2/ATP-dependent DNA helicase PcrA